MTSNRTAPRGPRAFRPDDPNVTVEAPAALETPVAPDTIPTAPSPSDAGRRMARGLRWGSLLLAALTGLAGIAAGLWLTRLVQELTARQDWIGWLALALLALAGLAALMLALREAWGLARLARLGRIRHDAESALGHGDKDQARATVEALKALYARRQDLAWSRSRFAEHERDIMDARELLTLAERELIAPLDVQARTIVAASAKRVSVLTAVSPAAFIDMAFVAAENLAMLRRLATLYGARPGAFGLLRLARMVVAHIVLTGGIALGDDLIQQMIGHGLAARLSARLGEGVFNGALTARIGIAAIDVCRPLPFIAAERPRFRSLVANIAGKGASARGQQRRKTAEES